jgi:hypothetical protein
MRRISLRFTWQHWCECVAKSLMELHVRRHDQAISALKSETVQRQKLHNTMQRVRDMASGCIQQRMRWLCLRLTWHQWRESTAQSLIELNSRRAIDVAAEEAFRRQQLLQAHQSQLATEARKYATLHEQSVAAHTRVLQEEAAALQIEIMKREELERLHEHTISEQVQAARDALESEANSKIDRLVQTHIQEHRSLSELIYVDNELELGLENAMHGSGDSEPGHRLLNIATTTAQRNHPDSTLVSVTTPRHVRAAVQPENALTHHAYLAGLRQLLTK